MAAMFRARYARRAFTLDAYGRSEHSAREALARGWSVHIQTHPGTAGELARAFETGDASVTRVHAGTCYRDGRQITK